MGINVSHGSNSNGEERRSCLSVNQLGEQLAHVLPAGDWNLLAPLFGPGFRDPVTVPPTKARKLAKILSRAAGHRLMPKEWADEARLFAAAAGRAADAGQGWKWD